MNKKLGPDYTTFDRGIVKISQAKDTRKQRLPELTPFKPSDSQIDTQLSKLWKPASLENLLKESMMPVTKDLGNLTPSVYQKKLKEAKNQFIKMVQEEGKRSKVKPPFDEENKEIFEQIVEDLDELEHHQDLLWMLRQVVHIA